MYKSAHWSKSTARILEKKFKDKYMMLYSPNDPFYEFLNYTIAHEADDEGYKAANKIQSSFNPQLCDLNETCFLYELIDSGNITQPSTAYGEIYVGDTSQNIALEICNTVEDFYTERPTRIEYDTTTTLTIADSAIGIVYVHNPDDRYGSFYITTDTNPLDTGSLFELDTSLSIIDSGAITRIETYLSSYYNISPEYVISDTSDNSAYYVLPYSNVGDFKLYDIAHLSHSGTPIEIDTGEYYVDTGVLHFTGYPSGRPSYNANYYDLPSETGQPDQYWGGYYAMTFAYSTMDELNNGLGTNGYFHNLPSTQGGYLYPNTPKDTSLSIPWEYAQTTSAYDLCLRCAPKYIRPGSSASIDIYLTRMEETTWNDASIPLTYTITDTAFYETSGDAVHILKDGVLLTKGGAVDSGTTLTIPAMDSTLLDNLGNPFTVQIYYRAHIETNVIAIASYTNSAINYSKDYMYDEFGRVIPFSILEIDVDGISETYANAQITVYADYDFKGICYDEYRKVMWSFENNNKYLTARHPISLNILVNYSLFKPTVYGKVELGGEYRDLIDYTKYYEYDIVSIKEFGGFIYLLSSDSHIYIMDAHFDVNGLDIERTTSEVFKYTPWILEDPNPTTNPVDFTFDKEANLVVLYSDGKINRYLCYRDYSIINNKSIYFRERYDRIQPFNFAPSGRNRTTDLDKIAVSYLNEIRYDGENLHEFYDRLYKHSEYVGNNSKGENTTTQGIYNQISASFKVNTHCTIQDRFFTLSKIPVELNTETGEIYTMSVKVDDVVLQRLGTHPSNPYDTGTDITGYVFYNSYKYTSLLDDMADTGYIIWRDYDGTISKTLEINHATPFEDVVISYIYQNDTNSKYYTITEYFEAQSANSGTSDFTVIPIKDSFLYDSGIMTYEALAPIEEYSSIVKRQWGYFTIDATPVSHGIKNVLKYAACYDIIDTGTGLL